MLAIARFHHTDRSEDRLSILELTITVMFTPLIVINIAPLTVLFCNCVMFYNCLLLKGISFNSKFLLVLCEKLEIICFVRTIFGIICPLGFWKFWNCPHFTRAILKFSKRHSGNLSQIALPKIWLLVLIVTRNIFYVKLAHKHLLYRPNLRPKFLYAHINLFGALLLVK